METQRGSNSRINAYPAKQNTRVVSMNALASDFDNGAEFYLHDKINECVKRKCKICMCARV